MNASFIIFLTLEVITLCELPMEKDIFLLNNIHFVFIKNKYTR